MIKWIKQKLCKHKNVKEGSIHDNPCSIAIKHTCLDCGKVWWE